MNIKKVLEKNGFTVKYYANGKYWDISQYTPAGEDWHYEVENLEDMKQIAENYDPEDDFNMWIEARQRDKTVPPPAELWQDQLWKQETLNKVLEDL